MQCAWSKEMVVCELCFPLLSPGRVLQQQAASLEASWLQWSLLATPLPSPEGQSCAKEAVVLPWAFAQLLGVHPALHSCNVQIPVLCCVHPTFTQIFVQCVQEVGTGPDQAVPVQYECMVT